MHLPEVKKKKYSSLRRKIGIWFIITFFTLVVLVLISYWPRLNIKTIEILGNTTVDSQKIENFVKEKLSSKYFWILPKSNLLIYPKNKIKKTLEEEFKVLKDISVDLIKNQVLKIEVSERKAKYLWCKEEETCYFLDETGFIFDQAPQFSAGVYFKFHGPIEPMIENPLGSYFSKENFLQLTTFKEALEIFGFKPVALLLEGEEVKIILDAIGNQDNKPEIFIKTSNDLRQIIQNLEAAINTEPLLSQLKDKYSELLYIDLRFGNKVYYRFE